MTVSEYLEKNPVELRTGQEGAEFVSRLNGGEVQFQNQGERDQRPVDKIPIIPSPEFSQDLDTKEVRNFLNFKVRDFANGGEVVTNKDLSLPVHVDAEVIKHSLRRKSESKTWPILLGLREIAQHSVRFVEEPYIGNREDVSTALRLYSPVQMGGEDWIVQLTATRSNVNGIQAYDVKSVEIEKTRSGKGGSSEANFSPGTPPTPSNLNVAQLREISKQIWPDNFTDQPGRVLFQPAADVGPEGMTPEQIEKAKKAWASKGVASPYFKKWAGKAKVMEHINPSSDISSGKPVVLKMSHGTTHDFTVVDTSRANVENDFGKGFYLTNSQDDVSTNYAGLGPDLTNRIQRLAEQLEANEDMSSEKAKEVATQRLYGGKPKTMEVYVRMKNPLVIGGDHATQFEFLIDENNQESGTLLDFLDAMKEAGKDFDGYNHGKIVADVMEKADYESIAVPDLIEAVKQSEGAQYALEPETGDLASSEIVCRAFQNMGYDGIIDLTANDKFGSGRQTGRQMEGMNEDTVHAIAFSPEQIKSATDNIGTFSASQDIRFQEGPNEQKMERVYSEKLNDALSGKILDSPIPVSSTPLVLQAVGANPRFVVMDQSVVTKAINKHQITREDLKKIPQQLRNPIAIIDSPEVAGSKLFLTDLVNAQGLPIVVAIRPDSSVGRMKVHEITTLGKRLGGEFHKWLGGNRLEYADRKRLADWLQSRGLQNELMPKEGAENHAGKKILTKQDVVNGDFGLFQGEGQNPRGAFQPAVIGSANAKDVIHIFKSDDRSTFAHEIFHYALNGSKRLIESGNAPQQVIEDYNAILKWVDSKDGKLTAARRVDSSFTSSESSNRSSTEGPHRVPSLAR